MINTDKHVYFWGDCIYSNWYNIKITGSICNNLIFENSEQLFMYFKARFFHDEISAANIWHDGQDPKIAKKLGRGIINYDDKLWSCVRLGYMTISCYLKFSQNKELKQELLNTDQKILVEASPFDKIWGIGISAEDAAAGKPWNGLNLLGESLMNVRKML